MAEAVTLEGRFVRLEPLAEHHVPGLTAAAGEDRSTYGWTPVPDGPEQTAEYVRGALAHAAEGTQLPFAVVRLARGGTPTGEDQVVGSARFYRIEHWQWPEGSPHQRHGVPDVTDIGYSWLARSAQRSPVNTETKLLLLAHAFEVWQVHRVGMRTDVRNTRSRTAIERIGARFEGVIRAELPAADDTVRDSARFSVVMAEWPQVKAGLLARLEQGEPAAGR